MKQVSIYREKLSQISLPLESALVSALKSLKSKLENFSDAEIERLRVVGEIEVDGMKLGADDVLTKYEFNRKLGDDEDAICDADGLMLCLNLDVDQTLQDEGLAREVVNRVQKLRKSAGLFVHDAIDIFYRVEGGPTGAKTDIFAYLLQMETNISPKHLKTLRKIWLK